MSADPVAGFQREFDQRAIRVETKYQEALDCYRSAEKNISFGDLDEAVTNTGNEFKDALVRAVQTKDQTEIGRLVMAALEKYLWSCACESTGLEDGP